jgi:hypothetical protein
MHRWTGYGSSGSVEYSSRSLSSQRRATFYTTGMEHSPNERDGYGLRARAVARDAAAAWWALTKASLDG